MTKAGDVYSALLADNLDEILGPETVKGPMAQTFPRCRFRIDKPGSFTSSGRWDYEHLEVPKGTKGIRPPIRPPEPVRGSKTATFTGQFGFGESSWYPEKLFEAALCNSFSKIDDVVVKGYWTHDVRKVVQAEIRRMEKYRQSLSRAYDRYLERQQRAYEKWLRRTRVRRRKGQRVQPFEARQFHVWTYTPKYFDFAKCKPLVRCSQTRGQTLQNPCHHAKVESKAAMVRGSLLRGYVGGFGSAMTSLVDCSVSAPCLINGLIRGVVSCDNTTREVTIPGTSLPLNMWLDKPVESVDPKKLTQAMQSCYEDSEMGMDLPLFLLEFSDVFKTFSQYWKSFQQILGTLLSAPGGHTRLVDFFSKRGIRESGSQLWTMFRALSGADLARKFGQDPSIRDLCTIGKAILGLLDPLYKQLARLVDLQGKEVHYHRLVDKTVETGTHRLSLYDYAAYLDHVNEVAGYPGLFYNAIRDSVENKDVVTAVVTQVDEWRLTPIVLYVIETLMGKRATDEEIIRYGFLDYFGLTWFRPSLLWEHIPFSFVIDWFVNVGDVIKSYDQHWLQVRPSLTQYVLTRKTWGRAQVQEQTHTFGWGIQDYLEGESLLGNLVIPAQTLQFKAFSRWVHNGNEFVAADLPTWHMGWPGLWEWLTGVELLATTLG